MGCRPGASRSRPGLNGQHLGGSSKHVTSSSPGIPRLHQDRPSTPISCFGWGLSGPRGLVGKRGQKCYHTNLSPGHTPANTNIMSRCYRRRWSQVDSGRRAGDSKARLFSSSLAVMEAMVPASDSSNTGWPLLRVTLRFLVPRVGHKGLSVSGLKSRLFTLFE